MNLPAIVLTAGLGTRLDPLTRLVAKPAVPLGRQSLIERVLAWIRQQGVTEAVLNLHHRPVTLTTIVGDGRHLGLRVRYSWEPSVLGSAGGPRRALPLIEGDPVLIVNGDTLSDFALDPMIEAHAASGADVTLAVVPNPAPDHYNGMMTDSSGRVMGFVPRGQAAGSWHFIGVQIARRRVFDGLRDGEPAETIAGTYRDIVAAGDGRIRVWPATTSFIDVGTPRDYLRAALTFADDADRAARGPHLRRTIVWPEAMLAADVELDGCVVAGPVRLGAGFRGRDAVIVPAALVTSGDRATVQDGVALFPLAE